MKQISEITDPRLVKALAHPVRIHVLRILQDRVASPTELSDELGVRLGTVSYHVRVLERLGLLELVRTTPRRGAIEHHYAATARLRITGEAWAQVPAVVKDAMVSATLEQIFSYVQTAAEIGGFDHPDSHATRQPMVLDARGLTELGAELDRLLERANQIETESEKRIRAGDHALGEVSAGLVLMLFGAPPVQAGLPNVQRRHTARSDVVAE